VKRHTLLISILVLIVTVSILGCVGTVPAFGTVRGSGRLAEEERPVSAVTKVELATFGDLVIQVGEKEELRIEAEHNLMRYIETAQRNGTLIIKTRKGVNLRNRRPVRYFLTVKRLESIEISGSGNVEVADLEAARFDVTINGSGDLEMGDLDTDTLRVRLSGSGDMDMDYLRAEALRVDITGSGKLDVAGGQIEKQEVTVTGSGDYRARGLESAEAEVRLTGSGTATMQVEDDLRVTITGSGDLHYVGDPSVDSSVTGSGEIRQADE
jgi:hypothetical protein